jgi:hypothetical protein
LVISPVILPSNMEADSPRTMGILWVVGLCFSCSCTRLNRDGRI